jgi:hypothetical protein
MLPALEGLLNVAVTVVSAFSVIAQLGEKPQATTLQPPNTELPSGHAFSLTVVPAG